MANLIPTFFVPGSGPSLSDADPLRMEAHPTAEGKVQFTLQGSFRNGLPPNLSVRRTVAMKRLNLDEATLRSFAGTQSADVMETNGNAFYGELVGRWYLYDSNNPAQPFKETIQSPPFYGRPTLTVVAGAQQPTSVAVTITPKAQEGEVFSVLTTGSAPLADAAIAADPAAQQSAIDSTATRTHAFTGLGNSLTRYVQTVHRVAFNGGFVYSPVYVTQVQTSAAGAGTGTGGGTGTHDGTVNESLLRLVPIEMNGGRPAFLVRNQQFRQDGTTDSRNSPGTFSIRLVTFDGVDITASWAAGEVIPPDQDGELKVTCTVSGTRYTTTCKVLRSIPATLSRSQCEWADDANGNGHWAQIPKYVGGSGTVDCNETAINNAIAAAGPNATIIVRNGTIPNQLSIAGHTKQNVTVKAATLGGVVIGRINCQRLSGVRLQGFTILGNSNTSSTLSAGWFGDNPDLEINYFTITGNLKVQGDDRGQGSQAMKDGKITWRFNRTRYLNRLQTPEQWLFDCRTQIIEQNIMADLYKNHPAADTNPPSEDLGDFFHCQFCDYFRFRGNVVYNCAVAEIYVRKDGTSNGPHIDHLQTLYEGLWHMVITDNFTFDERQDGAITERVQSIFLGDQARVSSMLCEQNVAYSSHANGLTSQSHNRFCVVRQNYANSYFRFETNMQTGSTYIYGSIHESTNVGTKPQGWSSGSGFCEDILIRSRVSGIYPNWRDRSKPEFHWFLGSAAHLDNGPTRRVKALIEAG